MMLEFVLVFMVLMLIIAAMAVGVMMGRKPLKGSCGGVGAALGEKNYNCDICGDDPNKCDEISQADSGGEGPRSDLAYDATRR
ncbi:(Na+)-NQR maturation NqrM [uncultured Porticoccus sp.]|uniref:(Na+)-NQR maturation NqrM n=1 Tax=Porticoccus sp. TaxID=2024853 RepID=UPI0026382C3D|nr:(Na+)-NQR maturation NqrM [uncultured Porticoccus sp.]